MTDQIIVERDGHVLMMGFNRPDKRNAFTREMFHGLAQAYHELNSDDGLRCGVLYAVGDHFTGGLDLPEWVEPFASGDWGGMAENEINPFNLDLDRQLSKPVVMAMQGICYTVGIELALAADIRVAASDTRFGQIEVKRGIYPVGGATVRMAEEFGWGNAMRYLLTGDEFDAQTALQLGLVQEVVQPGQQVERATELAQRIARQAPLGVYASLRSARIARQQGHAAAFERLLPDLQPLMTSEDAKEGVQSFLERREASFKGK